MSKAFVVFNLLLGLFLGGILQEMFAHINKLQLIIHLVVINVLIPPHTMIYFKGLFGFITFQIFDFRPMLNKIFALKEDTKIISRNLYFLGYESTYFISNLSDIFILLFFTCCMGMFIYGARNSHNPKVQEYRRRSQNILIWNGVYEAIRQPYIVFVVSVLVNTLALTWENTGVGINNILMFACFIMILAFPVWSLVHLLRNKQRLNERRFFGLYGTIYGKLKWSTLRVQTLLEPSSETFRVLIVCLGLIYLQKVRTFQWILCLVTHFMVLIYNGTERPFKERNYFFWQQLNECFVFWCTLLVMTFADQIYSVDAYHKMGTVLNVVVTINIVINFAWIIFHGVRLHYKKYQIKYYLWKRDKLKESIELAKRQFELD